MTSSYKYNDLVSTWNSRLIELEARESALTTELKAVSTMKQQIVGRLQMLQDMEALDKADKPKLAPTVPSTAPLGNSYENVPYLSNE